MTVDAATAAEAAQRYLARHAESADRWFIRLPSARNMVFGMGSEGGATSDC